MKQTLENRCSSFYGENFSHTVEKYLCDTNTMVIIIRVMNQVGDVLSYIH